MAGASTLAVAGAERQPLKLFSKKAYLDYSVYVILDQVLPHIGECSSPCSGRAAFSRY